MKHIKRTFILFGLIVSLFILCACNNNITFTIENKNLDYYVGYSYKPDFIIEGIDEYQLEYDYSSSSIEIINDYIHCLSSDIVELKVRIKDHSNAGTITLTININEIFPEEIIRMNPELPYVFDYKDNLQYQTEEQLQFAVPLDVPPGSEYSITVKAYKGDREIEVTPTLQVMEGNGSVLDDLRTRLR
jgi:hypothetical protein